MADPKRLKSSVLLLCALALSMSTLLLSRKQTRPMCPFVGGMKGDVESS